MTNKTKRQIIEETNQFLYEVDWNFQVSSLSGAMRVRKTITFKVWACRKAWDELVVEIKKAFKETFKIK